MSIRLSSGLSACSRPHTSFSTRFCSRDFDATSQRARSLSLRRRDFHSSLPGKFSRVSREAGLTLRLAMKKKQKGKAVAEGQDDGFGFEAQDGGDLFGDLAAEATKTTKAAPPILSTPKEAVKVNIQPNAAAYSPEKKARFEELFSQLENKAGKSIERAIHRRRTAYSLECLGKPPAPLKKFFKPIPPPEFGLLASLLALVQTPGDYERFTQVLAQWRQYPRRFGSQFMEHVICGLRYLVGECPSHDFGCALHSSRYQCRCCFSSSRHSPPPTKVWHQSAENHDRSAAYARIVRP
jgi:hypothetical protein